MCSRLPSAYSSSALHAGFPGYIHACTCEAHVVFPALGDGEIDRDAELDGDLDTDEDGVGDGDGEIELDGLPTVYSIYASSAPLEDPSDAYGFVGPVA